MIAGTRDVAAMHMAETLTSPASLGALVANAGNAPGFEALYEVYGMDKLNLDGKLLLTSPLDSTRIWTGEPPHKHAALPCRAPKPRRALTTPRFVKGWRPLRCGPYTARPFVPAEPRPPTRPCGSRTSSSIACPPTGPSPPPSWKSLLAKRTLQPCSPLEMISRGWVPPAASGRLLHTVNQQHLIALGIDQKLLPASIIRQVAQERAEALAQEQGYPVGRRQMRDLKMRVTEELRARALTRRRVIRAWIDPLNGWFVVDAAGAAKAEELTEVLRVTLGGSFAVRSWRPRSRRSSR